MTITMNRINGNNAGHSSAVQRIDGGLAKTMLRVMKADSLGKTKEDADEFVSVRNMAFSTITPEIQLVALNSSDKTIRSQAWLNMNLSPSVTRLMRGKVSRNDSELRKVAARALWHQRYVLRKERAEHASASAVAHARLAKEQTLQPKAVQVSESAVPATVLAATAPKAVPRALTLRGPL